MSCLDWAIDACIVVLLYLANAAGVKSLSGYAGWSGRLSNFHPRAESVFEEDAASIMLTDFSTLRWARPIPHIFRRIFILFLKMVGRDAIAIRMLLHRCGSRIEKVVRDALECSVSALGVSLFDLVIQWILQLNIWKTGEHLIWTNRLSNWLLVATSYDLLLLHVCLHEAVIYRLSLLYVLRRCRLFLLNLTIWRQWQIILRNAVWTVILMFLLVDMAHLVWNTISPVPFRPVLRSFDHWRERELLVVRIVTFFPSIPFSGANDLFVKLNDLMHPSLRLRSVLRWIVVVCYVQGVFTAIHHVHRIVKAVFVSWIALETVTILHGMKVVSVRICSIIILRRRNTIQRSLHLSNWDLWAAPIVGMTYVASSLVSVGVMLVPGVMLHLVCLAVNDFLHRPVRMHFARHSNWFAGVGDAHRIPTIRATPRRVQKLVLLL